METNILSILHRELQKHRDTFHEDNEMLKLKIHEDKGLRVFAKKTIKTNEDLKILDGEIEDTSKSESNWSRVTVNVGNKKKEYLLVGPINFVNHGCKNCANCVITDENSVVTDETSTDVKPYFVINLCTTEKGNPKSIRKGVELLCDYGETYGSIKCAKCGKSSDEINKKNG